MIIENQYIERIYIIQKQGVFVVEAQLVRGKFVNGKFVEEEIVLEEEMTYSDFLEIYESEDKETF